jgi:hypothetical protein
LARGFTHDLAKTIPCPIDSGLDRESYKADCRPAQANEPEASGSAGRIEKTVSSGGLTHEPNQTNPLAFLGNRSPVLGRDCDGNRNGDLQSEVKDGQTEKARFDLDSSRTCDTFLALSDVASVEDVCSRFTEVAQSARVNSPAQVAGFDAGKTPVLKTGEAEENKELDAKKKTARSIAIEPCKSSKYGWLIRVRLHSESGKPVIPISYMSDADYKALRRSRKRYADFKNNIKKQYQKTARQGDNVGTDSSGA